MPISELDQHLVRDGAAYADAWLAYQQERLQVPGIAVAIQHRDHLVLSRGYGFADLEQHVPLAADHIFRVASHSKTFTATAIMQLVEQGALRLDDRLATYIPWLQPLESLHQVTVRQTLNHAAGFVRDGSATDFWQLQGEFPDAAALRALVEQGGAVLQANEAFKYSNIGYSLLGLVIERASGRTYHQYVRREIVERLGLPNTGPEIDGPAQARLVTGYTARRPGLPRRPLPHVSTRAMAAATGFYSTAEDLCRYTAGHYLGSSILLSDASKREMQQPYWEVAQAGEHYGLGFVVMQIGARRVVGHGGGFPGHRTRTLFDPQDHLSVSVLINAHDGPAAALAASVVKILNFALQQSAPAAASASIPLQRFTGRFASMDGVYDVARFGDTLVELNPEVDDPLAAVTRLEILDESTLRIAETGGYGSLGELVRYERDGAGTPTGVIWAGATTYPLERFLQQVSRRDSLQ